MMSLQEPIVSLEHTLEYFGELPSLYHFRLYGTTDELAEDVTIELNGV